MGSEASPQPYTSHGPERPTASDRADPGKRFLALLLDSALLFFLVYPVSGALGLFFLGPFFAVSPIVAVTAYFVLTAPRTLGMRAAGIVLVNAKTGAPAGRTAAAIRGLLGLIVVVGLVAAALVGFSDNIDAEGNERYGGEVIITVALLGLLVALIGAAIHLWMFTNPERRALHDRLTGTRVVRDAPGRQG